MSASGTNQTFTTPLRFITTNYISVILCRMKNHLRIKQYAFKKSIMN